MVESNESDTWSESLESYFGTDDSSSSSHCPTPRRLIDLIADKIRSMNCVKNVVMEAATTAEEDTVSKDSNRYSHPLRLASTLREKPEPLNATGSDEDDHHEPTVRKVSFLDQPTYSGQRSNTKTEQKDVDVPSSSRAFLELPSSSADAAYEENLQENYLSKLLRSKDQSIFLLNFPELNLLVDSVTMKEVDGIERSAQPDHTNKAQWTSTEEKAEDNENALPMNNRTTGEVRVYKTGRVTIAFGEKVFEITKTAKPPHVLEVVRADLDEATHTRTIKSLGFAQHYLDVLPQMEKMDEIDE